MQQGRGFDSRDAAAVTRSVQPMRSQCQGLGLAAEPSSGVGNNDLNGAMSSRAPPEPGDPRFAARILVPAPLVRDLRGRRSGVRVRVPPQARGRPRSERGGARPRETRRPYDAVRRASSSRPEATCARLFQ